MWGPDGVHCTTRKPRETYAEAAGKGEPRVDVAAVLEAFRQELKAEIKKNMLEVVEQALSAQTAASPAGGATPRGGGERAQDPGAALVPRPRRNSVRFYCLTVGSWYSPLLQAVGSSPSLSIQ